MQPDLAKQLRKALPSESVLDDPLRLSLYGYDGTLFEGTPELAILPETTEHVVAAVRASREAGIPLVPRGAATSLSGGPVPLKGGVVVSFTRMDCILELDYPNQRAVVQPGIVNLDFQKVLAKDGYFYAPDPASQCVCTLGGNVGENSGGPHCLKYGVTANHVLGLEVVLPDGRLLRTGGKCLDYPGYDLTGILVGSEGTFGLVTEIVCRVMPNPETVTTMLAVFDSLDDASQSVSDIIAAGIIPATLEMMDNAMIQAVEKNLHAGYPLDAEAVLIIELDGLGTGMGHQVEQAKAACNRNNVRTFQVAKDETQRALFWKGRKGAFGAVVNIAPSKICTDISVPRNRLPRALAEVMEISRRWNIPITNVFHAGDGNLHPLVLFDPRDEDQVSRAKAADREITELAVKHGGVLTGEHGIGCGKKRYMPRMFSPAELRLLWRVKESFDPEGLCNPEKVLPEKADIPYTEPPQIPDGASLGEPDTLHPADQEAVRVLLALADREKRKIMFRGAGTKSSDPPTDVLVVDLSRLNRIISHDYENLTVTVEAGAAFPQIDELLASRGQMLPIRPRFADRATAGGIVSTNDCGPQRLLYGAARDLLIGIKAALPGGDIVRFGGPCVKNVAGYAVEKLFIGSQGSLGAILEMTFRTLPRPEAFRTLVLPVGVPGSSGALLTDLLQSGLRPAAIELVDPAASALVENGLTEWCLLFGLEGLAVDVDELTRRVVATAAKHRLDRCSALEDDYFRLWGRVTDFSRDGRRAILRAACPPSHTTELAAELSASDSVTSLRASPGLGLIHCTTDDPEGSLARARDIVPECGGILSWLPPAPAGLRMPLEGTVLETCARLKNAFDPNGVLPDVW